MAYHFVNKIENLFNLANAETVAMSDQVGDSGSNTMNRLADVIPITRDDIELFNVFLQRGGSRVFEVVAKYADPDSDYPYYISDGLDSVYPSSVIYKLILPDDVKPGIAIPLLTSTICKALVTYVVKEWLILKGMMSYVALKEAEFETSLSDIQRGMTFGHKATKKYNAF